jgi:hypothetical protein
MSHSSVIEHDAPNVFFMLLVVVVLAEFVEVSVVPVVVLALFVMPVAVVSVVELPVVAPALFVLPIVVVVSVVVLELIITPVVVPVVVLLSLFVKLVSELAAFEIAEVVPVLELLLIAETVDLFVVGELKTF